MTKELTWKPCRSCGAPVDRYRKPGRSGWVYKRRCPACIGQKRGHLHPLWKGGRYIDKRTGYAYVRGEDRIPRLEHRIIWEEHHGPIPPGSEIHHLNGDRGDNRIENLSILTRKDHLDLHNRTGYWARGWDACRDCGTTDSPHAALGLCNRCRKRRRREAAGIKPRRS